MSISNVSSITKTTQTARDRSLASQAASVSAIKLGVVNTTIDQQVATLTNKVVSIDSAAAINQTALQNLFYVSAPQWQIDAATATIKSNSTSRGNVISALYGAQVQSTASKAAQSISASLLTSTAAAEVTTLASGTYAGSSSKITGPLQYNASAVFEAYFSGKPNFTSRVQGPMNAPSAVKSALDLWTYSSGSKGMIVTSEQVLKAWNAGSNKPQSSGYFDNHNYGFQFQYNPGTVSMSYFTAPNVDVAMMTSGTEMFNLAGVSGSQGSVSFQITINRIFDMNYLTPTRGAYGNNVNLAEVYPVQPYSDLDYLEIYEKGTMYDVEYLLRVLMGTTMTSYLRGQKTADMGWLPAIPVELHLGKSLRYLGTINSLNLNHIIFDSRMVPIFTTMDIAFARLPDYPPAGTTATP